MQHECNIPFVVKLHYIPASHTCIIYISYIFIFCTIYIFSKKKKLQKFALPLLDLKSSEHPCMFPLCLSVVYYQEQIGRQLNVGTNKVLLDKAHIQGRQTKRAMPISGYHFDPAWNHLGRAKVSFFFFWLNINNDYKNRPL